MNKLTIDDGRAYYGGVDLMLTTGEFRIVKLLASRPGGWFTYRKIYDALRDSPGFYAGAGEMGVNANVRSAIKRIRRKFEQLDPAFSGILNYTAYGYALRRGLVAETCCPTCGQVMVRVAETVAAGLVTADRAPDEIISDPELNGADGIS